MGELTGVAFLIFAMLFQFVQLMLPLLTLPFLLELLLAVHHVGDYHADAAIFKGLESTAGYYIHQDCLLNGKRIELLLKNFADQQFHHYPLDLVL